MLNHMLFTSYKMGHSDGDISSRVYMPTSIRDSTLSTEQPDKVSRNIEKEKDIL